jgi:NADH:ubiquinone oxidoreductase subunit E
MKNKTGHNISIQPHLTEKEIKMYAVHTSCRQQCEHSPLINSFVIHNNVIHILYDNNVNVHP